jgi:hypothetical protein
VAWLAGSLWQGQQGRPEAYAWARRYVAASLFLLYPFSYQAVSWIAAMMHPLATFFVLAAFSCYVLLVQDGRRIWAALSLLLTFLAPFAHEIGMITVPLLLGFEFLRPSDSSLWRRVGRAAVWIVPVALWFIIWRSVPAENTGTLLAGFGLEDLWRNTIYASQAIAYPVTWLSARFAEIGPANEFVATAFLSVVTILGIFGLAIVPWRRKSQMTLFAWFWVVVAMAPAVLFIPFRWMSASPRVLMLASVAVAWIWADVFIKLAQWMSARPVLRRPAPVLVAVAVFLLLGQGIQYIRAQTQLYVLAGSAIDQLVGATAAAAAQGRPAMVINFPAWLSQPQTVYALGEDGVLILGNYSELAKLIEHYTGQPATIDAVQFQDIRQEVPYHAGLTGSGPDWTVQADSGAEVFVTRFEADNISIQRSGALKVDRPGREPLADFEGLIALLDAQAMTDASTTTLTLTWQVQAGVPQDITVFVHLLDTNGQLVGQADGDPLSGTFPFWSWEQDLIVEDQRAQPVVETASVLVGLYSRTTGQRLQPTSAQGSWPDAAVKLEIGTQN